MKVLIACEESQTVCKAFRALGHEAYSCDVQEPSGGPRSGIFGGMRWRPSKAERSSPWTDSGTTYASGDC